MLYCMTVEAIRCRALEEATASSPIRAALATGSLSVAIFGVATTVSVTLRVVDHCSRNKRL